MSSRKITFNLGHALVKTGNLSKDQFKSAYDECLKTGKRIKDVLISFGYINETDLAKVFSRKLNMPAFSLKGLCIHPDVKRMIPVELARKYQAIPVFVSGNVLAVATDDPLDYDSLNKIADHTQKDILTAFTSGKDITYALNAYDKI